MTPHLLYTLLLIVAFVHGYVLGSEPDDRVPMSAAGYEPKDAPEESEI